MGKTRKVSKAYSSVFVPDYRHAVETVAESEGFGCSGRVGNELAVLDDSSALSRKCYNLNEDRCDVFGRPMKILSLSMMSQLERSDLVMRLKSELEQVRMFRRKIESLSFDAINYPPTNETNSNQNESSLLQGRKTYPPVRNGPGIKGGAVAARRIESVSKDFATLMKQCSTLLTHLMRHEHAWIFNEPVDIVKHNIPDYFNVIKHPMDLGTVKGKLRSRQYSNPMEFAADVRLTFRNASTYNPAGHTVYNMAEMMSKYFEMKWRAIEKKIPARVDESVASKSSVIMEPDNIYLPPTKKQKTNTWENQVKQEPDKKGMSDSEKNKLSGELEALIEELPDNIIDFLKETSSNGSEIIEDELEIDIGALNDTTLFTLRKLLDDYLLDKQKSQAKLMPFEVEMHNESRFSNSSAQHRKDLNQPAHEEVDIGGDDPPPISNCVPVEIDKDAAPRSSNCSTSSNSSNESGSSSSDSDLGRSAGELDVAMNSAPANTINETEGPIVEDKESGGVGGLDCAESLIMHAVENANASTVEPNCHQEGESGPSDRQVSPEKLYRAALLRSRFADIIIKAQENNTIEKGERSDVEKLKFEKDELDRRRKEEKARLQAQAKVAEEAKRKAEEEAAAEAKQKRELEREAARQALLQMQKTVDINESSQFMEDLEMLTAAPDENLQNLIEDGSPENSQNILGSFKFPVSSNPLEQLGLYMKTEEDDDEEEVEPQSMPNKLNGPNGDSD